MSITKYQALLETAAQGSITRAAEVLGYTQGAVSRMLADLEADWGLPLFRRGRGGVLLTPAGEELLEKVQAVCNAQQELEERVDELHGLRRGSIRIGSITSISVHWLPELIQSFQAQFPHIRFSLRNGVEYAQINEWIQLGQVDFGFLALPGAAGLQTVSLRRDRLMAVLPPQHPLAGAESCPIALFAQEAFIRPEDDRDREILSIFQRAGIRPKTRYAVGDDYAVMAMVSKGLGLSILPELELKNSIYPVAALPLDPPQSRELCLAFRSRKALSPAAARFLPHVLARFGQGN